MHGPALLFCPADRPDRYAKAASAADSVIIDLEDAVSPENRASARESVVAATLDPTRTIVRVNPVGTPDFDLDLAALRTSPFRTVMLAKTESAQQLDALAGFDIIGLCETPAGVENAGLIAAVPHVIALMWGAEDLVGAIGGRSSRHADGSYRDVARYARSRVLIAAAAAGKAAIDTVHLDIADLDGLKAEVEDAAAVGFAASACIHPSQVAVVRDGYAPTPDEIAWAERVLAAAESNAGVFRFEGRMVDGPVLIQARTALAKRARP
jgi:citrate lyase subunit beta/citryl-CoA lyase